MLRRSHSTFEIITSTAEILDIKVSTVTSSDLIRPNDNPLILGDNTKLKIIPVGNPRFHFGIASMI